MVKTQTVELLSGELIRKYSVTKKEAFERLKAEGITQNEQMVQKWCQKGLIDAVRVLKGSPTTKGLYINPISLETFILVMKKDVEAVTGMYTRIRELEEELESERERSQWAEQVPLNARITKDYDDIVLGEKFSRYTITMPDLDIVVCEESETKAVNKLVVAVLNYAREYLLDNFEAYINSPITNHHLPIVLKVWKLKTPKVVAKEIRKNLKKENF
ncbi:hypothetical protein [Neobacillus sp. PS3-40]|uniref:hypothetical protein n=1 Tax=Neobacillus sp. PS3-40 TaxID=3070679 RepID=UPI0027E0E628|nr:hypothetical protein [Neobacillus sp. PS3-40]WML45469.1 hypothetical protein RCG20_06080 [Neobacillus sp. PS3-40]